MKNNLNYIISSLTILTIILFGSCRKYEYENIVELENGWHEDSLIVFDLDIKDIESDYCLKYKIRNNMDYPYYNLYIQYTLTDSNNIKIRSEVQEVILLNPKTGKPYGKGFSDVFQHSFIAIDPLKFKDPGKYKFSVKQYMRKPVIEGILSVGISLEKTKATTSKE